MNIILRDVFGSNPMEFQILEKEEIETIIENIDWKTVVEETLKRKPEGFVESAEIDLETGKIGYHTYSQGGGDLYETCIPVFQICYDKGWSLYEWLEGDPLVKLYEETDEFENDGYDGLWEFCKTHPDWLYSRESEEEAIAEMWTESESPHETEREALQIVQNFYSSLEEMEE